MNIPQLMPNIVQGPPPSSYHVLTPGNQGQEAANNYRLKHHKAKAQANYANMSNNETNPVGALQERFQSRGIAPTYRVVQAKGASHAPVFSFQVILGDLTSTGTGSSKKQAKHSAARAMLDKLDGRVLAQDGQQPLPPVQEANGTQEAPGNTVGALQELCVKHGYPMPTYSMGPVGGQPHQRNFAMVCTVGSVKENGVGCSKKVAKREAAQKMIDKLNTTGLNNVPASASGDTNITPEEVKKISNMKVDILTPDTREKVTGFFNDLNKNVGTALGKLHLTPLKSRSHDYEGMLKEISTEQNFEVTYVEMEEKTEEGEQQCLVQISTLPVAVCYAAGPDSDKAKKEAARVTLNYLKLMTRSAQRGKK